MNRRNQIDVAVWLLIVALGVTVRVWLHHLPNFAPAAAVSLFAGYYFRKWLPAIAAPLLAMSISDMLIGTYTLGVLLTVYACILFPLVFRGVLQRQTVELNSPKQTLIGGLSVLSCSLISSLVFFALTNLAVWAAWYDADPAKLGIVYSQALPFFRYTLLSDATFGLGLFAAFATAKNLGWLTSRELAAE